MTVVKIQRPIWKMPDAMALPSGPYLVYDKFRARESLLYTVPNRITKAFDNAPRESVEFFKQYFDNAEWEPNLEYWDLTECTPVTRRLIW